MSPRKQSKRMRSAHELKQRRVIDRVHRQNRDKPGYVGVVRNAKVNGVSIGMGAMFWTPHTASENV